MKKNSSIVCAPGLAVFLLCWPEISRAVETNFPYAIISRRNVFSLVAVSPATNFPPPPAPLTRLKLTGFAFLPPHKWAVLQIKEADAAPVGVALEEGESLGAVQLISVNAAAGIVAVRNGAVPMELALEKSGGCDLAVAAPTQLAAEHRPIPVLPPLGSADP